MPEEAALDVAPPPMVEEPPSFINSPFPTKAEYEACIQLPPDARKVVWQAAEKKIADYNAPDGPETLVGKVVELHGLKSRAELNGRRGRVLNYNPDTGRAGVLLKSVQMFGGIEKSSLALLPANLRVVEAPAAPTVLSEGHVSWALLLDHLKLPHLKQIHWSLHEEKLCEYLMPQEAKKKEALALLAKAGVVGAEERQKLLAALLGPVTMFPDATGRTSSMKTVMKLLSARLSRQSSEEEKDFKKEQEEHKKQMGGVPRADSKFRISNGRVCEQRHGKLEGDVAKPPLKAKKAGRVTVYPTREQADTLAGLLRMRVRNVASIGNDERVFEGMLENRGINVMAIDSDTFQDEDAYYEQRIYCKEVRRVGIGHLQRLLRPDDTALIFVNGMLTDWEAYLARYPELPLVIAIGRDDSESKTHHPRPGELANFQTLRLLSRMPIDVHGGPAMDCAVYERVQR